LFNLIAALPQSFLNKNSGELSLPLLLLHLKKFLVLFYRHSIYFEKPNPEIFFCKKLLKKKRDLENVVIEQL